jgi:hypothetical protein
MTDTAVPLRVRIEAAHAWRPEAGAVLEGHLVAVVKRTSEYGTYPVLVIDDGVNESFHAFHAFHSISRDKLKTLKPARGEKITIAYAGQQASRTRKDKDGEPVEYHSYIIYCPDREEEDPGEYDWDDDSPAF